MRLKRITYRMLRGRLSDVRSGMAELFLSAFAVLLQCRQVSPPTVTAQQGQNTSISRFSQLFGTAFSLSGTATKPSRCLRPLRPSKCLNSESLDRSAWRARGTRSGQPLFRLFCFYIYLAPLCSTPSFILIQFTMLGDEHAHTHAHLRLPR